jgi:hypothetical protein
MSTKDNLIAVLENRIPDTTPLAAYDWNMGAISAADLAKKIESPEWGCLLDQGLGIFCHCECIDTKEHGVETTVEKNEHQGNPVEIITKKTPVGEIRRITGHNSAWHIEDWIKQPKDYLTAKWIVEHTELIPRYERFEEYESVVGDNGVVILTGSGNWLHRSPLMKINIDWAGTENFCMDLAMDVPELFEMHDALMKQFLEEQQMLAEAPGRYVKWIENLTISMLGPDRYRDLLLPVYGKCVPILEKGNKKLLIHYDGELRVIADYISQAPFHVIDSLSEPPEGDMLLEESREKWPDKALLANISLHLFETSEEELSAAIRDKLSRAGKKGFCFELSEDRPANWQQTIPVILETLNGIR